MNILEIINDLKEYSRNIDTREVAVGARTKRKFIEIWQTGNRKAKLSAGQIRISNQGPPTYAVTDELLLKCAKAVELYKEYDRLKELLETHISDRATVDKIGAEKNPPTSEEKKNAIHELETFPELVPDLEWLKMMLEDKATRGEEGHIGPFKQIFRPDRWQPALSVYIGTLAADAYPNSITNLLMEHIELTREILHVGHTITEPEVDGITFNFSDPLLSNLAQSLLTKSFVIITGASGTGKTMLARNFANYFATADRDNIAEVAVGADWTDNRNVVGFVNHLRQIEDTPVYQTTPVLDLILHADEIQDTPHFLILDEMNLSHVERYFADFLSAMEMRSGKLLLHGEGEKRLPRHQGDLIGVPPEIPYPANLFVIGTVNIDETTYMFSPKVLDRANVIEFKVNADDIGKYLNDPAVPPPLEPAGTGIGQGYLELAKQAREGSIEQLPEAVADPVNGHLVGLFEVLERGRFEFAFRTAKEINHYLRVCRHLADDRPAWDGGGWRDDLDHQILQKLLPKIHGSMGRVGPLLAELANYCHKGGATEAADAAQTRGRLDAALALKSSEGQAVFHKSLTKLKAMIATLRDEQFVSFIQ